MKEYKVVTRNSAPEFQDTLNECARESWTLVSFVRDMMGYVTAVLEREAPDS